MKHLVDPGRRRGSEALLESRRVFEERQSKNHVADSCGSSSSCILNMQQRCAKERNVDQKRDTERFVTAVTVPVAPTGRSGASTASSAARREAVASTRSKKVGNPRQLKLQRCGARATQKKGKSSHQLRRALAASATEWLLQSIDPAHFAQVLTDHRVVADAATKGTALDDATFDGEDELCCLHRSGKW